MYSLTKLGNNMNSDGVREFIADTLDDVQKLPRLKTEGTQQGGDSTSNDCVMAGSTCLCLEDSSVWILGNDDKWKEL